MNINEYKEAMNEIPVDTSNIEETLHKKINYGKNNLKKLMPIYGLLAMFLLVYIIYFVNMENKNYNIVITAYASGNEQIYLTDKSVTFNTNVNPFYGGTNIYEEGKYQESSINYNINFICEGPNIKSITYKCTDKEVSISDRNKSVYYVENITMPVEEYQNLTLKNIENAIAGFYGIGMDDAQVIKFIGNSYTVSYDKQKNTQYGLIVSAKVAENGNYKVEDITIKVDILMEDGTVIKKEILIHPEEDAFNEIEIQLLN